MNILTLEQWVNLEIIRYHNNKYKRNDTIESVNKQQTRMDTFLNHHKCPPACAKKITEFVEFMVAKDLRPAAVIVEKGLSNFYPSQSLDM